MMDMELEIEMEACRYLTETAQETPDYSKMSPGDRLKAKMADFQRQREAAKTPEQRRLEQKVASSQNNYDRFQNTTQGGKNVEAARSEMNKANLDATKHQIDSRMSQETPEDKGAKPTA